MPTVKIHNVQTGEVIEREMTAAELEQWEKDQADIAARVLQRAEREAARKAIFEKLGLTEEEAKLLLS